MNRLSLGSRQSRRFELIQFHWHAESEHLINGEAFPLEMHLVHQAADGELLVIGVFIEEGDKNRQLDRIFRSLPQEEGDIRYVRRFNLSKLLPDEDSSYRYVGSLATAPYTEGVESASLAAQGGR